MLINFLGNHHDQSFSVEEIANQLKSDSISISAVYRNSADLEKDGKIRKIAKSGTHKAFYQFVLSKVQWLHACVKTLIALEDDRQEGFNYTYDDVIEDIFGSNIVEHNEDEQHNEDIKVLGWFS